ncbi:hypothetical protein [Aquabacterium sp. J223]|uniref:hypothetical protein n=1 Tax=Aquabacterium sp. J223 TaxID=2898431 RepID=UPI0021AD7CA0|nr:hypothetical protein [Aquabacterium sp. J223]UUX94758.1 hypothetical protein LRS07_15935 [Aquabacterium sp. J223]
MKLPEDLQRFILVSVPSVPYLEALLLMRNGPPSGCSAAELARSLYIADRPAADLLAALAAAGVVAPADAAGRFRYAPAPALAAMLDRLAEAYAQDLIAVTRLIHDGVHRNAQRFADAFRLRK